MFLNCWGLFRTDYHSSRGMTASTIGNNQSRFFESLKAKEQGFILNLIGNILENNTEEGLTLVSY